mmetsp:Transcript_59699/g.129307  ORF Transcript_59699/g.129307 Transcript_59699/m.129307 type:complete len:136 (-) Transcript_59699:243-650(-)
MVRVKITIVGAQHLPNKDSWLAGVSDPFCRVTMVNKPEPEIRTKTIENCLSPTWNHTAVMEWDGKTDLHFLVMDQDMVKDEFLGECYLRSSDVKKGFNGTMSLTPGKKRKVKKEPVLIIKVVTESKTPCGSCAIL